MDTRAGLLPQLFDRIFLDRAPIGQAGQKIGPRRGLQQLVLFFYLPVHLHDSAAGTHPRYQFLLMERLGQIVIRASRQPLHNALFLHSSGPDKSGNIQSVIMIWGRNVTIDASASCPFFANANSYGCPRNACSSNLRENGESSTARTRIRPLVLSTAGAATAISCLSSRLIIRTCGRLRKGFYGRGYLYDCPLRPSPQPRSKTEFPES